MKFFYIPFLLLITTGIHAQYKGGVNDGSASHLLLVQNPINNIYAGGPNDGFATSQINTQNKINNIYGGGANDGTHVVIITGMNPIHNIYTGGLGDGFSIASILQQNPINNIYAGGINDGTAVAMISAQNPVNNIYSGGINDGSAVALVLQQNFLNNIYSGGGNDGFVTIQVNNQNPIEALPVRLTEFSGKWQGEDIDLWWRTTREEYSSHFEVERSVGDGNHFTRIGTVQAAGNSNAVQFYPFTDRNLPDGTVYYYRLKSVDVDGEFTYSAIIRFTRNARSVVYAIYPNPSAGRFNIGITGVNNFNGYGYRVFSGNGALVAQGNIVSANTQFDITRLAAGNYYVQVINQNKIENTYKIILQH